MHRPFAPNESKNQAAVIRAELIGDSIATAAGVTATGFAPALELCRALTAAGHDPAKPLHAYRGNVLCMTVRSIGEGARLYVEHSRHGCPIFRHRQSSPLGAGTASPKRDSASAATGHRATPQKAIPDRRPTAPLAT